MTTNAIEQEYLTFFPGQGLFWMPRWQKVLEVYTAKEAGMFLAEAYKVLEGQAPDTIEADTLAAFLKTKGVVACTQNNVTEVQKFNFGPVESVGTRSFVNKKEVDWQEVERLVGEQGYTLAKRQFLDNAFDDVCPVYFATNKEGEVIAEGKGLTHEQARRSALSEAVERLFGASPDTTQAFVVDTYRTLYQTKPWDLGGIAGPRDTFGADIPTEWIGATNISRNEACYLPAEVSYFGYSPKLTQTRLFSLYHTTGLASGSSLEEAALSGIFEVLERDAYWITMRCKINSPDIDLRKIPGLDPKIVAIVRGLEQKGFKLFIKDMSLDWGIPIAHAVLHDTSGKLPAFTHGTGAGFTWAVAVSRAVCEALQMYSGQLAVTKEPEYWRQIAGVVGATAHGELAWSDPLFAKNIEHLITPSGKLWTPRESISSVKELLSHLAEKGHEIVVAKLSSADGLVVARVIITNTTQPDPRLERISARLEAWRQKEGLPGFYTDAILT